MDRVKTFSIKQPSAGTTIQTINALPAPPPMSPVQRANLFFGKAPVHTPGSGNLMHGTPKARERKKHRK
jgi:hypothetical protein